MAKSDEILWQPRLENFGKALGQLESACAQAEYSELERAGLVQVFQVTMKLAWNTLEHLLFYEGFETKTPREAIRTAFEAGYLTEQGTEILLEALTKRNVLSHTYDESNAKQAEHLIKMRYTPVFRSLYDNLRRKQYS